MTAPDLKALRVDRSRGRRVTLATDNGFVRATVHRQDTRNRAADVEDQNRWATLLARAPDLLRERDELRDALVDLIHAHELLRSGTDPGSEVYDRASAVLAKVKP